MKIHGILSTYLGEDEFDLGKSIRWNQHFCDTEFVMDLSHGDRTRTAVIDWAYLFPDIRSAYYQNSPTFFEPGGAAEWRKTSFNKADATWDYDDNDWVIFVDCTEGISINEAIDLLPAGQTELNNPNIFWPWLEMEISDPSTVDQISLPVYAFVGNSPTWWTTQILDPVLQERVDGMADDEMYKGLTKDQLISVNQTSRQESYQSWTHAGWSPRMFKVSVLRNPAFDWSSIDKFTTTKPAAAAKHGTAIMSYVYARWTRNRYRINRATFRPMAEGDDDGFEVRKLMSLVRPVAGLPHDLWSSSDTAGRTAPHVAPPAEVVAVQRSYSSDFSSDFSSFTASAPTVPGAAWGSWDTLQLGFYPEVIRETVPDYFLPGEISQEPWNYWSGQPALYAWQREIYFHPPDYTQPRPPMSSQIMFPDTSVAEVESGNPETTTASSTTT